MYVSGIVLRMWVNHPVYHYPGHTAKIGDEWWDYTICGRQVPSFAPWIPMKHLEKFARPCKDCEQRYASQV